MKGNSHDHVRMDHAGLNRAGVRRWRIMGKKPFQLPKPGMAENQKGYEAGRVVVMITSDGCHNYGIHHGCDERCPVLLAGDCRNIEDAIESCDISDDERVELLEMYPNRRIKMNNEKLFKANELKEKIDYAQKQLDNAGFIARMFYKNARGEAGDIKISTDLMAIIKVLVKAELQKNLDTFKNEFEVL